MILNFEYDKSGEVKVFMDDAGIYLLMSYLNKLLENKDTHFHLMTKSWGGFELTDESIDNNLKLINQVLLQKINK